MKKYVLVVAVAAALFSCSGNPKADATQTDKNKQETAQVPDMHNAETSLDYWGVYEGTLPAASSPGIKTTLTLNKDKTFTLRSEYIDEKDGIFNDKGTYTLDGNVLTTKHLCHNLTVNNEGRKCHYIVFHNLHQIFFFGYYRFQS